MEEGSDMEIVKGILLNIVSTIIVYVLGFLLSVILVIIKPDIILFILIAFVIFCIVVAFLRIKFKDYTKFKWGHTYLFERHTMVLKSNKEGEDYTFYETETNKHYLGYVEGEYIWDDIKVKKFILQANNANIELNCEDNEGKRKTYQTRNEVSIENNPIYASYKMKFDNNRKEKTEIKVVFTYDTNDMKPEFFVEVGRPMKTLILELKVQSNVRISGIKKKVATEKGDVHEIMEKDIRCKEIPGYNLYIFKIRHPMLFYRYSIEWEWN